MKRISFVLSLFMALALSLCSCSNNDYINAIPGNSTLLISMKPAKLSGVGSPTMLKAMLHVNNLDDAGLDLSEYVFFFEDAKSAFLIMMVPSTSSSRTLLFTAIPSCLSMSFGI